MGRKSMQGRLIESNKKNNEKLLAMADRAAVAELNGLSDSELIGRIADGGPPVVGDSTKKRR